MTFIIYILLVPVTGKTIQPWGCSTTLECCTMSTSIYPTQYHTIKKIEHIYQSPTPTNIAMGTGKHSLFYRGNSSLGLHTCFTEGKMNSRMNDRQPSPPSDRRRPWWEQTGGGHHRRRRRSTPSKYFVALLALATSSPRSPFSSAYVADDDEPRSTKVIGNYGPHRYNARNGLSNPTNIDYTKLTRINYGPFRINENGAIWGSDVNADPQLLYGPRDWNPPSGSTVYCHIGSAEMSTINSCGTHHYEEGLLYQANSVYVTIGGREYADEFRIITASTEGRVKVSSSFI